MKKTLLLPLALGFAGASLLQAATVDVYITGSTAFRANVYTACQKLFVGANPPVVYGDVGHGGGGSGSGASSWCMSGTPIAGLTNLQGNSLVIHGLFTGSIQGLQTTEASTKLVWATPATGVYTTNSPTIGFSDASGAASPYPARDNFVEEDVCVQPFVFCKSTAGSGAVTNINNVTWEQLEFGIPNGRIPLSAWTYKTSDTNNFVYLLQRTKDSGTRRCETQGAYYQFNDTVGIYLYDYTNNFWYVPTTLAVVANGSSPSGVIGTEGPGNNNANLNWGYGFIGGGDIKNTLNNNNPANQSIAMLSLGDSKGVGSVNWNNVISYNGLWPTLAGAGIHGNIGTNDFSPITLGYYPLWGFEVLVHPINPGLISDQNISATQLGNQTTPGTFMGVFNAQTLINHGSPLAGSIEDEIVLSQPNGATGIPLAAMQVSRPAVGGTIYPPFQ